MKIFFNSSYQEIERVNNDLFVKGNTGNVLEAYFDDVDLKQTNINIRLVIMWADGTSTKELPMSKAFTRKYVYLNLPTLLVAGETAFTLRIYDDDNVVDGQSTLLQTAIFTRKILNSVDESDKTSITNDEYLTLLKAIENLNNAQEIILTNVDAKPTLMTKEELDILSEENWQAKLLEAIGQLEQLADNNLFEITGLEEFDIEEYNNTINSIKADISSLELQFYDYYTKGDIQAIVNNINSNINAISTRIDDLEASGTSITVDSELSSTSTNPVQNKAIFNRLGLLSNGITSNNENITINTNDITKLKSRVATAESDITSMDARVTILENSGGGSGSETSITIDDELSSTSTNPVQNGVITKSINSLTSRVTTLENSGGTGITIDEELDENSTNPVQNKVIATEIANLKSADELVVDDELSPTSTNPVQNKVVTARIQTLESSDHWHNNKSVLDTIYKIEDYVYSDSSNPVESKGIYSYVEEEVGALDTRLSNELQVLDEKITSRLAISSLLDTTWVFNDTIDVGLWSEDQTFSIYFKDIEDNEYKKIEVNLTATATGASPNISMYYGDADVSGSTNIVYRSLNANTTFEWIANKYKVITITGGDDVRNGTLINFMKNTASLAVPMDFVVDSYLDANSTNPVQNKVIYEKIYTPHNALEQKVSGLSNSIANILEGAVTSEEKSLMLKEAFNHQFPLGLVNSYLQFKSDTWDETLFSKIEDNYDWAVTFWDAQQDSKYKGIRFNVGGTKGKIAFLNEQESLEEVYTLDEGWGSSRNKTIIIKSGDAVNDDVAWDYWFNDNIYQLFDILLVNKSVEIFSGSSTNVQATLNSRGGTLIVRGRATASPENYDTFTMTIPIIAGNSVFNYIDIPFSTEYPSTLIHGYVSVGFDFDSSANTTLMIGTSNVTILKVYQVVS